MLFKLIFLYTIFHLSVSQQCRQLDMVLVVDSSKSVSSDDFAKVKTALSNLVTNLDIGPTKIRLGLINYSSSVSVVVDLADSSQTKANVINKVSNLYSYRTDTATGDALNIANNLLRQVNERPLVPRVVVLLTDGFTTSGSDVYQAANNLKNSKVSIYTIAIGPGTDMSELEKISDKPSSTYVKTTLTYDSLLQTVKEIANVACQTPVFIETDVDYRLDSLKDQVKSLQLILNGKLEIDVVIDNKVGDVDLQVSWVLKDSRVIDEANLKKVEKIGRDGKMMFFYALLAPPGSQRAVFKTIGLKSENIFDIGASLY